MKLSIKIAFSIGCLTLFCAACGEPETPTDNNGWNVENNKKTETYKPVTITFNNKGDSPLFYSSYDSSTPVGIFDKDDKPVLLNEPYCNCDDFSNCPVGVRDQALEEPKFIAIGQATSREWDGSYWVAKAGEENCYEKVHAPKGTTFNGRLCHGTSFHGEGFSPDGLITDRMCEDASFTLGTDTLVEKDLNQPFKSAELSITIKNTSNRVIRLNAGCSAQNAVRITQESIFTGEPLLISKEPYCDGTKICGETSDSIPERCTFDGAACEQLQIEPGEELKATWNASSWIKYPLYESTERCQLNQPTPHGKALGTVCYSVGDEGTQQCVEQELELGKASSVVFDLVDP